ncbi:MAG: hypothetical protein Q7U64_05725 [Desulfocapsaceae bacterium]|nr:hypothetical protein [Desulfocapsaceae bacterium]
MIRKNNKWQTLFYIAPFCMLSACVQNNTGTGAPPPPPPLAPVTIGQQGNVAEVGEADRARLNTKLTITDFNAFAEKVTDKMLQSPLVAETWGNKKPMIIIAIPDNTTHDANLRADDIQNTIVETILNSQLARVGKESPLIKKFDYIIKSQITSTPPQRTQDGRELVYYKLQMTLSSVTGEMVGMWSDQLGLAKSARSMF